MTTFVGYYEFRGGTAPDSDLWLEAMGVSCAMGDNAPYLAGQLTLRRKRKVIQDGQEKTVPVTNKLLDRVLAAGGSLGCFIKVTFVERRKLAEDSEGVMRIYNVAEPRQLEITSQTYEQWLKSNQEIGLVTVRFEEAKPAEVAVQTTTTSPKKQKVIQM